MPTETRRVVNDMLASNGATPDHLFFAPTEDSTGENTATYDWEDFDEELPDLSHEGGEYQQLAQSFSSSFAAPT